MLALFAYLVTLLSGQALARDDAPWTDERFQEWRALYLEGRTDKVLKAVQADLARKEPHPWAAFVWVSVHDFLGDVDEALQAAPPKVQKRLERSVWAFQRWDAPGCLEVVARAEAGVPTFADPWEPAWWRRALAVCGEEAKAAEVLVAGIRQHPHNLKLSIDLSTLARRSQRARDIATAALAEGGGLHNTAAFAFLDAVVTIPAENLVDDLAAIEAWQHDHPGDPVAAYYRAERLRGLEVEGWDDATLAAQEAMPFYFTVRATDAAAYFERDEELERWAQWQAQVSLPDGAEDAAIDKKAVAIAIGATLRAGWREEARAQIAQGLQRWPEDQQLLKHLAEAERLAGRWEERRDLLQQLGEKGEAWVETLNRAGDSQAAADLCQQIPWSPPPTVDLLGRCASAFQRAEAYTAGEAFTERALALYPGSSWLMAQRAIALAKMGRIEEATALAYARHDERLDDNWAIGFLVNTLDERTFRSTRIADLEHMLGSLGNHDDDPWLFWLAMMQEQPGWGALVRKLVEALNTRNERAELLANLDKWVQATFGEPNTLEDQRQLERARVWATIEQGKVAVTEEELQAARTSLQAMVELQRGHTFETREFAAHLARLSDDHAEAVDQWLAAHRLDPDSNGPGWAFIRDLREDAGRLGFRLLMRRAQRSPYDEDALHAVAFVNCMWGGSAVVGFAMARRYEEVTHRPQRNYETCAGQLGNPRLSWERYTRGGFAGTSRRYLQWLWRDASKSMEPRVSFTLEEDGYAVRIVQPDGTVRREVHDPLWGMPIRLEDGPAWAEFGWHPEKGELASIRTSTGRSVDLTYDSTGKITGLVNRDPNGEQVSLYFRYDLAEWPSKPSLIAIEGVGEIRVQYDAEGEIADVDSDGGYRVALQVTQAFQRLLSLSKVAANRDLGRILGDTSASEDVDRAYNAMLRAQWLEDPQRLHDARLALADALVVAAGADPERLVEARGILDAAARAAFGDLGLAPERTQLLSLQTSTAQGFVSFDEEARLGLQVDAGVVTRVDVIGGEGLDVVGTLLDSDGEVVDQNDDGGEGSNARLFVAGPFDGTLVVRGYGGSGGSYRVELAPASEEELASGEGARAEAPAPSIRQLEDTLDLSRTVSFEVLEEGTVQMPLRVPDGNHQIWVRSASVDVVVELWNADGDIVDGDDDSGPGRDALLSVQGPFEGNLRVGSYRGSGAAEALLYASEADVGTWERGPLQVQPGVAYRGQVEAPAGGLVVFASPSRPDGTVWMQVPEGSTTPAGGGAPAVGWLKEPGRAEVVVMSEEPGDVDLELVVPSFVEHAAFDAAVTDRVATYERALLAPARRVRITASADQDVSYRVGLVPLDSSSGDAVVAHCDESPCTADFALPQGAAGIVLRQNEASRVGIAVQVEVLAADAEPLAVQPDIEGLPAEVPRLDGVGTALLTEAQPRAFWEVPVQAGVPVHLRAHSDADTVMEVHLGADHLETIDDAFGRDPAWSWEPEQDGTVVVMLRGYGDAADAEVALHQLEALAPDGAVYEAAPGDLLPVYAPEGRLLSMTIDAPETTVHFGDQPVVCDAEGGCEIPVMLNGDALGAWVDADQPVKVRIAPVAVETLPEWPADAAKLELTADDALFSLPVSRGNHLGVGMHTEAFSPQLEVRLPEGEVVAGYDAPWVRLEPTESGTAVVRIAGQNEGDRGVFEAWTREAPRDAQRPRKVKLKRSGEPVDVEFDAAAVEFKVSARRDERHLFTVTSEDGADIALRGPGEVALESQSFGRRGELRAISFVAERGGTYRLSVTPQDPDAWWLVDGAATATLRWDRAPGGVETRPEAAADRLVDALQRKLELENETRADGLPREVYIGWRDWERRLRRAFDHDPVSDFLASEAFNDLQLLPDARWLARHDLVNPALWRRYGRRELLARGARDARFQHLAQSEDTVLVGTSRGVSAFHEGHWRWLAYDLDSGFLQGALDGVESVGGVADVRRVGLTDGGAVWLATADGLIRLPSLRESGTRWTTSAQGLTSSSVRDLVVRGERVVVGTDDGAAWFGPEGVDTSWRPLTGHRVSAVLPLGDAVLVGGEQGLWRWTRDRVERLLTGRTIDALANDPATNEIYAITAGELRRVVVDGNRAELAIVREAYDALADIDVTALVPMRGHEGRPALGVMTEVGLAVLQDDYLEYNDLRIVGTDAPPVLVGGSARGDDLLLLTTHGVLLHRPSRATRLSDLGACGACSPCPSTMPPTWSAKIGGCSGWFTEARRHRPLATACAMSWSMRAVASSWASGLRSWSYGPTENWRRWPTSRATTRLRAGTGASTIWKPRPTGVIWGVTDTLVFRWDGERVQTWSGVDPTAFPCSSHYLERVLHLPDGRIWAVASDENHIDYDNVRMVGGLCEWTGEAWVRSRDGLRSWFFTSTTQVDDDTMILGSNRRSLRYRAGRVQRFSNLEGSGWSEMLDAHPMAYQLTRGAHLGDDVWLFGSAAGVLAYHDGRWFYPDRINGLLPDDAQFHHRGGRIVHAVETDPQGRVYVGTHRGLLIFDTEGERGLAVLRTTGELEDTVEAYELRTLQAERDAFFASLPEGHASLEVRDRWERLEREVRQLRAIRESGVRLEAPQATVEPTETAVAKDVADDGEAEARLKLKEKELYDLLLELQAKDPSMAQFLGARPLELQQLRERLPDKTLVVQFLPSLSGLQLHLVRKDQPSTVRDGGTLARTFYKDLDLSVRDALFTASNELADLLEAQAERVRGGSGLDVEANESRMNDLLHVLYVDLIRPIEEDLAAADQVVFIPAGPLSYVPFAALRRPEDRHRPLVQVFERLTISVMPSLYLTDLLLDDKRQAKVEGALVVGDPTSDLEFARKEAQAVARMLKTKPLIGGEAVLSRITDRAPGRRYLHFATHGELDDSPKGFARSFLQLAHDERLYMNEVMAMKLHGTEAVVLSACKTARHKTGEPGSGSEYTTLARAFAHAGSDTTVASLWSVPDEATRSLMERFYAYLQQDGVDAAEALTRAQRELAGQVPVTGWAGFLAFGL